MSSIVTLSPLDLPGHRPSVPGANEDHPMRVMTRRAAGLVGPPWDHRAAREVAGLFNGLAPQWHTRESGDRTAIVEDALERGLDALRNPSRGLASTALELGSGLGTYSGAIAGRFDLAIAAELAVEMHQRAHRSSATRLLADGSALPLAARSLAAVVLINCFLFPAEIDRVLAVGGVLVWVNSSGESTPIHLDTSEVVSALRFPTEGVEARAGIGTWCALRRTA